MKDLRDPQALGKAYLELRKAGVPIDIAVRIPADPYTDDGFMSSNPANHHSKVRQDQGDLTT